MMKRKSTSFHELTDYLASLVDPTNPFSGESALLPASLGDLYARQESLALEIYAIPGGGSLCPEDLRSLKHAYHQALFDYRSALLQALPDEYRHQQAGPLLEASIRLKGLEYRLQEDVPHDPLYADVLIHWKDDCSKEEVTIKLSDKRVEDHVFFACQGITGLCRLIQPNNGEDFVVRQVDKLYGGRYHLNVEEFLTMDVFLEADSADAAARQLQQWLDTDELVLDADDYTERLIYADHESPSRPDQVRLFAVSPGTYAFTVVETLCTDLEVDAGNLDAAKEAVEYMIRQRELVLGADAYRDRSVVRQAILTEDGIKEPFEVELIDEKEFLRMLQAAYPEGAVMSLTEKQLSYVSDTKGNQPVYLEGCLNRAGEGKVEDNPKVVAWLRLAPEELSYLQPNIDVYTHPELSKAYDSTTASVSVFVHCHPDLTGGQVTLLNIPLIRSRLQMVMRSADQALTNLPSLEDTPGLCNDSMQDKELGTSSDVRVCQSDDATCISEVRILEDMAGRPWMRCRIGGVQQSLRRLSNQQVQMLREGRMTPEQLADECFADRLADFQHPSVRSGWRR